MQKCGLHIGMDIMVFIKHRLCTFKENTINLGNRGAIFMITRQVQCAMFYFTMTLNWNVTLLNNVI